MCAAAITRGDVLVKNVIPKHMESISAKLLEMGNTIIEYDESIRVIGKLEQKATDVKTLPYPGFSYRYATANFRDLSSCQGEFRSDGIYF